MADFTIQQFLKANEDDAKMGFFKKLKCWKRAGNGRTAVTGGKDAKMGFFMKLKCWKRAGKGRKAVTGGKFSLLFYEITDRFGQFYSTATDITKPRWE